ncbi:hypothetical protein LG651_04705 [Tamlana sp. 62-3]|uniref:Uncharacterized protein n=1 Tax=Neotamlana sargassicola TaxID=2883125 RepID=A0A9X1I455_9FLAO|nr:hypothetical protein [Tamlana sargassicola]MCB4807540.1 hypothetical protein [Tamlana sargassicola]
MSNFHSDLLKEQLLAKYLDGIYKKINLNLSRVSDLKSQHQGIDLIYKDNYLIDEKAQLNYINSNLPTFAFELSYLKGGIEKKGWLFDKSKVTTHYFLITGIKARNEKDLSKGFTGCKITSVDRKKLIEHLEIIGLTQNNIANYVTNIRNNPKSGKTTIRELNPNNEGYIYYTSSLAEKPINLVFKLDYLIKNNIAKRIYPI